MKSHSDFSRLVCALRGIGIFSNRPMFDMRRTLLREGFSCKKVAIMKEKKKTNLYPAIPFTRMMLEQLKKARV